MFLIKLEKIRNDNFFNQRYGLHNVNANDNYNDN